MLPIGFNFQPTLQNEFIKIRPLEPSDFETLYSIASDPLIWEQHPNKNRYQKEAFENYFKGAIESGGAFLVVDAKTGGPIGSSRFCDAENDDPNSIAIGYTFIARSYWGSSYNQALKTLMISHAFNYVNKVVFHIGADNVRSQKAIIKTGAIKTGEIEMEYYGEETKLNYVYEIARKSWVESHQ